MNPLTNMKNVTKLSEQELYTSNKTSWHDQYRDSAWIFIGGLPYDLTEGDIICIFSQYGEIVNINLIRDKDAGKSKGFCFLCYEDQRSTVLAVDNFNGFKLLNRTLRVDHVSDYRIPKEGKKTDVETKKLYAEGCAPKVEVPFVKPFIKIEPQDVRETLADQIEAGIKLPARLPIYPIKTEKVDEIEDSRQVKVKKPKKDKKKKKKSKSKRRDSSDESSTESESETRTHKKKTKNMHENTLKKEFKQSNEFDVEESRNDKYKTKVYSKSANYGDKKSAGKQRSRSQSPNEDRNKMSKAKYEEKKYGKYRERSRSRSLDRDRLHNSKKHKSYDSHRK